MANMLRITAAFQSGIFPLPPIPGKVGRLLLVVAVGEAPVGTVFSELVAGKVVNLAGLPGVGVGPGTV